MQPLCKLIDPHPLTAPQRPADHFKVILLRGGQSAGIEPLVALQRIKFLLHPGIALRQKKCHLILCGAIY